MRARILQQDREIPKIPTSITVHLGSPDSNAQNVTVPFIDYIKNVASSEIYPTWDESALRANILAQVSFALNRVYTEFYRAQGKDFDITSSTAIDQKFIYGRNIFQNVGVLVDELFNDYIRRIGFIEPLAAKYCNGTTVTCAGLSQWGSENLAQTGYSYLDILYNYYGRDIELVINAPVSWVGPSYPGYPISRGASGANVVTIQTELNRISTAYPAIPKIYPVDGVFGEQTERAVRKFQQIFNLTADGIVGPSTWYTLVALYTGLLRLSELNSLGQTLVRPATASVASFSYRGSAGYYNARTLATDGEQDSLNKFDINVRLFQYVLNVIAEFYSYLQPFPITGEMDTATRAAVSAVQLQNGLPQTGYVDEQTANIIYDTYVGIVITEILNNQRRLELPNQPFSRTLSMGSQGQEVVTLQHRLNYIYTIFGIARPVFASGTFDNQTATAVKEFQVDSGLVPSGDVDEKTWNALNVKYNDAVSTTLTHPVQFPGRVLKKGDRDTMLGVR